ncbi:MAG: flagellar hook assembly protein FlgD [Ruminiclostridium sp.]
MAVDSIGSIQENHIKYSQYFSDKQNGDLSVEDFYTLLLSEMTNQDPLEPTSNTEFISQMATFTSMRSQQDALYYSNANYASSLVGKTVIVSAGTGTTGGTISGVVSNVNMSGDSFTVTVNGRDYALKSVVKIVSDSQTVTGTSNIGSDGAYATSLIGKRVTISAQNSSGATVLEQGVVDSIEVQDRQFSVIVNGLSYSIADVVRVQNENTTAAADSVAETAKAAETEVVSQQTNETEGTEADPGENKTDNTDVTETLQSDDSNPDNTPLPPADETDKADIADVTDEKEDLIKLFS